MWKFSRFNHYTQYGHVRVTDVLCLYKYYKYYKFDVYFIFYFRVWTFSRNRYIVSILLHVLMCFLFKIFTYGNVLTFNATLMTLILHTANISIFTVTYRGVHERMYANTLCL